MKLKVGEKYELNNGEVHECARLDDSDGLFLMGRGWCTETGCFSGYAPDHDYSVKRHIPNDTTPNLLDYFTHDAIRAATMGALENNQYTAARELIEYLEATK